MEVLGLVDIPTWLQWLSLLVGLVVAYVVYMSWNHNTFKKMGIDGPKPNPIFGNMRMFIKDGLVKTELDMYRKYGKVFGMYESYIPVLYIADPALLKDVLVKDFKSFVNRRDTFKKYTDPITDSMLTQIQDDHWRFVRNTVSPTFSSKKLRQMTPIINGSADKLMEHIEAKVKGDEDIDMKTFIGAFTMDVIAGTAFGLDVDSQNNPDDPFLKHARLFSDSGSLAVFIVIVFFLPFLGWTLSLCRFLGIQLTKVKPAIDFFSRVTNKALKERRSSPGKYNDFLGILVKAEGGESTKPDKEEQDFSETSSTWTRNTLNSNEIIAQATLFYVAGYDTTSNTISFLMYHLALHPEVCDKLMREIDETLGEAAPDYDNAGNLSYMEMCINESMRLFPAAARIDRMANNDVTIGNIKIPKGMIVNIPIGAIHMDPEYWPEPEKYDPERFTNEAKANRDPFVFMPFGAGPRNCVGMRLALLELKIGIARILQKYRPVKSPKTEVPVKVSKMGNIPMGLFLKFEKRN
ncbi:cytochrome P450 3A25-like [Pecten maximus]|uniref:cytochrome P450 3A25-like n=1 Tax=Pecten maximus TaxID=6579 RepID=UPI001458531F|nr:cytochrome P450 3A25-like [Pecten maximus]XP_033761760.1 cytochrome P450 3A25-like [Pecten maximus]